MRGCLDDNTAVEFLEGSLPDHSAQRVEKHAATCDECRHLLAELARATSFAMSPSQAANSPTLPAGGAAHIDLERGQEVGRFVVLARIGRGGMGVVFAAYDPRLDRKVALKLLHSGSGSSQSTEEAQRRLLREAQAIAQLSHPNVISVYDVGTYNSEVYIAMEFVEGETLTGWLRRWDRPWQAVLEKFTQAGRALAAAHGAGMVHRDFKPDNVLVGGDERVRVMDFGLARSVFHDGAALEDPYGVLEELSEEAVSALNNTLTKTGSLLGTPRYMAPESFTGRGTDASSDQFSFCVALYEAVYGQHPFEKGMAIDLADKAPDTAPREPPTATRVPRWLHRVLVRGMKGDPKDRYPSMDALLRAMTPPRRRPSRLALVAAMTLGVMVAGLGGYIYWYRQDTAKAIADVEDEIVDIEGDYAVIQEQLEILQQERDALMRKLELVSDQATVSQEVIRELRGQIEIRDQIIDDLRVQIEQRGGTPPPRRRPPRRRRPPADVEGISLTAVQARVDIRMDDIRDCFAEWRERYSDDRAELALTFDVHADGRAVVTRKRGLADKVLRECVAGMIALTAFPASDGVTEVRYKFVSEAGRQLDVTSLRVGTRPSPERSGPQLPPDITPRLERPFRHE